jgi:hypothetical protein
MVTRDSKSDWQKLPVAVGDAQRLVAIFRAEIGSSSCPCYRQIGKYPAWQSPLDIRRHKVDAASATIVERRDGRLTAFAIEQ